MKQLSAQVCVLGGGPAGASAARRLAMIGHSVVLVEKTPFPRPHIGESLTGSVLPLLDVLELRNEIEQEGFLRTSTSLVRWAGPAEARDIAGQPGFQVDRSRFDSVILDAARDAGVQVFQPAKAVDMTTNSNERWTVVVRPADGNIINVDCDFLLDATGRASALGGSKRLTGLRTLALYAYWKDAAVEGPETRVEAGPSEWFWGAPLPQGVFNGTVFVENDRYKRGIGEAGSVDRFYDRLIGSSQLLSSCLTGTRMGKVQVCDATCVSDDAPIWNGVIKAGESAFTIDPLSSQGVQTAIGSALHAAAVIHTMLERPANSALAREFYLERHRRSVTLHTTAAARLYAEAAAVYPTDFWLRRSTLECRPDPAASRRPPPELKVESVVRLHPHVCLKQIPVIEGAFVAAAIAVTRPNLQEPVVFLDGVRLAPLIQMLDGPIRCSDLLQRWAALIPPRQAVRILRAALALGILCSDVADRG